MQTLSRSSDDEPTAESTESVFPELASVNQSDLQPNFEDEDELFVDMVSVNPDSNGESTCHAA